MHCTNRSPVFVRDKSDFALQVLKFVTCDRLFELHPSAHEGRLALRKDAVVSNVALARIGRGLRLSQRLTTPFQCDLAICHHKDL